MRAKDLEGEENRLWDSVIAQSLVEQMSSLYWHLDVRPHLDKHMVPHMIP